LSVVSSSTQSRRFHLECFLYYYFSVYVNPFKELFLFALGEARSSKAGAKVRTFSIPSKCFCEKFFILTQI